MGGIKLIEMEKLTYNERVRAIAEKMARAELPNMYIQERGINYFIKKYTPSAQIAVSERAEGFKMGYIMLHASYDTLESVRDECIVKMKEYGLIPGDAQEGLQDA